MLVLLPLLPPWQLGQALPYHPPELPGRGRGDSSEVTASVHTSPSQALTLFPRFSGLFFFPRDGAVLVLVLAQVLLFLCGDTQEQAGQGDSSHHHL